MMPEKPVAPPPTPPWMPLSSDPPAVGDAVVALGYPMLWSAALSEVLKPPETERERFGNLHATRGRVSATSAWRVPAERSGEKKLTALDKSGVTHCLHSACVASGASGGPLANARGEAVGVHSFGDAFYGATRDVAVLCDAATCADGLGFDARTGAAPAGEVCAEAYATRRVNENIARTSDPALKQMCPELSEAQRKAWIL